MVVDRAKVKDRACLCPRCWTVDLTAIPADGQPCVCNVRHGRLPAEWYYNSFQPVAMPHLFPMGCLTLIIGVSAEIPDPIEVDPTMRAVKVWSWVGNVLVEGHLVFG